VSTGSLGSTPFISDLSASEFLLTSSAGFRPEGLVFGCSVFHAGTMPRRPKENSEVAALIEFVAYGTAVTLRGGWPTSVTPEVLVLLNDNEPRETTKMTTFDRMSSLPTPRE
jgi:hypothetical protein